MLVLLVSNIGLSRAGLGRQTLAEPDVLLNYRRAPSRATVIDTVNFGWDRTPLLSLILVGVPELRH